MKLRSLHDKVFIKHLGMNKPAPLHVTKLFTSFIKGITYFKNEESDANPIYHRLYSCGPYANTYRQGNLVCVEGLSKKELMRRRSLIERCYIERLIYNELWKHETLFFPETGVQDPEQDPGHMFRLKLTKKDFETCFPNIKIDVSIQYENNFPFKLVIVRKQNENVVVLTFTKSMSITSYGNKEYDEIVECKKEENGKTHLKLSTFLVPSKF